MGVPQVQGMLHAVDVRLKLLVLLGQALQDGQGLFVRGLRHVHRLETALQSLRPTGNLLEMARNLAFPRVFQPRKARNRLENLENPRFFMFFSRLFLTRPT